MRLGMNGNPSGRQPLGKSVGRTGVNGARGVNRAQVQSVTTDSCKEAYHGLTEEQKKLVIKGVKMELYYMSLEGLKGN